MAHNYFIGETMTNFGKVKEFMKTFGQEVVEKPQWPHDQVKKLRLDLIQEELEELEDACEKGTLIDVADALTDILYVVYGAGHSFGIDLDKCFAEVHQSNMSKLDTNGKPLYNKEGKVIKGPRFRIPDLEKVLYERD